MNIFSLPYLIESGIISLKLPKFPKNGLNNWKDYNNESEIKNKIIFKNIHYIYIKQNKY